MPVPRDYPAPLGRIKAPSPNIGGAKAGHHSRVAATLQTPAIRAGQAAGVPGGIWSSPTLDLVYEAPHARPPGNLTQSIVQNPLALPNEPTAIARASK